MILITLLQLLYIFPQTTLAAALKQGRDEEETGR